MLHVQHRYKSFCCIIIDKVLLLINTKYYVAESGINSCFQTVCFDGKSKCHVSAHIERTDYCVSPAAAASSEGKAGDCAGKGADG